MFEEAQSIPGVEAAPASDLEDASIGDLDSLFDWGHLTVMYVVYVNSWSLVSFKLLGFDQCCDTLDISYNILGFPQVFCNNNNSFWSGHKHMG